MSSSDSSPSPSPSPPASPVASGIQLEPSLDQLVVHFIAAKRSLASISHAWRANELATNSRALIEEIAILDARNAFACRGIQGHVDTLQDVRHEIFDAGQRTTGEFKIMIDTLDQANGRLQDTLKLLRQTVLHESLQRSRLQQSREVDERDEHEESTSPFQSTTTSASGPAENQTLHDFIKAADHEDILAALRNLIDEFQASKHDFDDDLAVFDSTLSTILQKLAPVPLSQPPIHAPDSPTNKSTPTIRILYTTIESNATSMATLLQSLIAHYDLCVSALKHTEGGGHAAYLAAQAAHLSLQQPPNTTTSQPHAGISGEESLYLKTVPEPISSRERAEMLSILTSDAQEVSDVVAELRDRSADMETCYSSLSSYASASRLAHRRLHSALTTLHRLRSTSLASHLHAQRAFQARWQTHIQPAIASKTAALNDLTDFHVGFKTAYENLLAEIERREAVDAKMRKVAERAQRELDRLWELDCDAREGFLEDVGGFLPMDLYPRLSEGPRRWVLQRMGEGEEQG